MSGNLLLLCLPTFVTGLFLQFIFAHKLQILPLDGFGTTFFERLRSVVLPALTLGLYGTTSFFRLVRHETIAILDQDFLRTARAGPRVLIRSCSMTSSPSSDHAASKWIHPAVR